MIGVDNRSCKYYDSSNDDIPDPPQEYFNVIMNIKWFAGVDHDASK
jgi:hypothetical protein